MLDILNRMLGLTRHVRRAAGPLADPFVNHVYNLFTSVEEADPHGAGRALDLPTEPLRRRRLSDPKERAFRAEALQEAFAPRSPYAGLPAGLLDEVSADLRAGRVRQPPSALPEGEFNRSVNRWAGNAGAGLSRAAGALFEALGEPVNAARHAELTRRAEQFIAENQPRIRSRDEVKTWGDLMDLWESRAGGVAPTAASWAAQYAFPPARPILRPLTAAGLGNHAYHWLSNEK